MVSEPREGLNCLQSLLLKLCQSDFCFRLDTICPGGTQLNVSPMARMNFCLRQTLGLWSCTSHCSAGAVDSLTDNKPVNSRAGSCTQSADCFKAVWRAEPCLPSQPCAQPGVLGDTNPAQVMWVIQDLSLGGSMSTMGSSSLADLPPVHHAVILDHRSLFFVPKKQGQTLQSSLLKSNKGQCPKPEQRWITQS